jgi:hypothetical protein
VEANLRITLSLKLISTPLPYYCPSSALLLLCSHFSSWPMGQIHSGKVRTAVAIEKKLFSSLHHPGPAAMSDSSEFPVRPNDESKSKPGFLYKGAQPLLSTNLWVVNVALHPLSSQLSEIKVSTPLCGAVSGIFLP